MLEHRISDWDDAYANGSNIAAVCPMSEPSLKTFIAPRRSASRARSSSSPVLVSPERTTVLMCMEDRPVVSTVPVTMNPVTGP